MQRLIRCSFHLLGTVGEWSKHDSSLKISRICRAFVTHMTYRQIPKMIVIPDFSLRIVSRFSTLYIPIIIDHCCQHPKTHKTYQQIPKMSVITAFSILDMSLFSSLYIPINMYHCCQHPNSKRR